MITRIVGDIARKAVTILGAWLAAKGMGAFTAETQTNLVEIISGGVFVAGSMIWSYWHTNTKDKNIDSLATQVAAVGEIPVTAKGVEIKPSGIHAIPLKPGEIPSP